MVFCYIYELKNIISKQWNEISILFKVMRYLKNFLEMKSIFSQVIASVIE